MDKVMIGQWNRTVGPKDTVYCLGDFTMLRDTGFDEVCKIIEQLNGYIKLIWGNHDHRKLWGRLQAKYPDKIELLGPHIEINVDGHDFTVKASSDVDVATGEQYSVGIPAEACYLFDAKEQAFPRTARYIRT